MPIEQLRYNNPPGLVCGRHSEGRQAKKHTGCRPLLHSSCCHMSSLLSCAAQ